MNLGIIGSRGFPSTYGGYETLVRHLARDWVGKGHTVTVYCRSREGRRRAWATDGVRCCWTPGRDSTRLSTLSFGASAHVHALTQRFDAVLVLNVANGYFLPLLKARGIPCAVNTDGIEWERGKWGPLARSVFLRGARLTARYADVLIADSQAIAAIWSERFNVRSEFIPYGAPVLTSVDTGRVRALGLVPQQYLLVVARLIPENNVALILDAIEQMPVKYRTVIVGSADYHTPLERRLREADHGGSIRWLGHVADQELLTQLWANCSMYIHGHSVGGTNPSLLQAMGAGAPTLALDTPFNREVLGRDAQLYPRDASALSRSIMALLGDARLRAQFAEHGRRVIARRYDWTAVTTQYFEALQLARQRASGPYNVVKHDWARPPDTDYSSPLMAGTLARPAAARAAEGLGGRDGRGPLVPEIASPSADSPSLALPHSRQHT